MEVVKCIVEGWCWFLYPFAAGKMQGNLAAPKVWTTVADGLQAEDTFGLSVSDCNGMIIQPATVDGSVTRQLRADREVLSQQLAMREIAVKSKALGA